jgi:hypothetical protein
MIISHSPALSGRKKVDVVVVPYWINRGKIELAAASSELAGLAKDLIKAKDFTARAEEICPLYGQFQGGKGCPYGPWGAQRSFR